MGLQGYSALLPIASRNKLLSPVNCVQMCIMAGCDFVKALPGVGMKKAHGHMRKLKSIERVGPAKTTPHVAHTTCHAAAEAQSPLAACVSRCSFRRRVAHGLKPGASNAVCLSYGPGPSHHSACM